MSWNKIVLNATFQLNLWTFKIGRYGNPYLGVIWGEGVPLHPGPYFFNRGPPEPGYQILLINHIRYNLSIFCYFWVGRFLSSELGQRRFDTLLFIINQNWCRELRTPGLFCVTDLLINRWTIAVWAGMHFTNQ